MTNGRPITFAHLISIATVVIMLCGAMVSWAVTISLEARDLGYQARLEAAEARPFPYTSLDAREDRDHHEAEHASFRSECREFVESRVRLAEEILSRKIETLPRPPKETQALIDGIDRRLSRLEQVNEQKQTGD